MKSCAYYKIIPELKLVIEFFGGNITIEDVLNTKRQEIKDNYDPNFNFIVDFREARNMLSEKELKEYINYVTQHQELTGNRKSAIISNTPIGLVTTSIYAMFGRSILPMDIRIAQNLTEAMEWTDIDWSHYELISKYLLEYKGKCYD